MTYCLLNTDCFRGTCCSAHGGHRFLQNVGTYLLNYMVSHKCVLCAKLAKLRGRLVQQEKKMFVVANRSCLQPQLQQLALCQLQPHLLWSLQQPLQLLSKVEWTKWRLRTQNRPHSLMPWQMVSWHILYRCDYHLFTAFSVAEIIWQYKNVNLFHFTEGKA